MRKKNIAFFIVLFFTLITFKATAAQAPNISSDAAVLMDLNSGQVLYQKNANKRYGPASTTKIMTALIVLEKSKLDDKVVIGKTPPYEEGSKIYVIEGEEFTVEQLLYAVLLESANDAALALAEHIGGSKEGFAQIMNDKSKELGCKNTHFVNPNGLYDDNHYTTAYDLAIISKKAMENEKFREIVSTISYKIPPTNKQPQIRYLNNHNKLLFTKRYGYEGADGIKTGYTIKSRHTFVGSVTRGNMRLVTTILRSEKSTYDDTKLLFDYGLKNFQTEKTLSKDQAISNIKINETGEEIPVYPEKDLYVTTPKDQSVKVNTNLVLNESFSKINKGEAVGYAEIFAGEALNTKVSLLSGKDYKSTIYEIQPQSNGSYKKVFNVTWLYVPAVLVVGLFSTIGLFRYKKSRRK